MPSVTNPMQQAIARNCVECLRSLVETPPFYSVDACCGSDGLRPIHIAAREGHIQTLRFLSSAGACLQRSDLNGCTALHFAAASGQLRAVRWLLRHGAKILLDVNKRSPIQVAADYDHMEIVNVLAKHATTTISSSTINNNENGADSRTSRRSSAQTSDKDTSDFTTGSVDDYSFNTDFTHNRRNHQHNKPFSHLHTEGESQSQTAKISTSPGDCNSSSGNSSLSASNSAPSLSPSSSSAVSCGCSTSDETTLVKSVTDVSDTFTLEEEEEGESYDGESSTITGTSLAVTSSSSSSPFYLHPPHKLSSSSSSSGAVEVGKGILKKSSSNHKRQGSTAFLLPNNNGSTPFFLHPPENLVNETQKVVGGKISMAPVNSSHSHHHHFVDPSCPETTPKLKVGLAESSSSSSGTSSPPQTPPGTKSGMSTTISECISKFQTENNSKNNKNHSQDVKFKNHINNSGIPPPPPPPPPMPSAINNNNNTSTANNNNNNINKSDSSSKHSCPLPNLPTDRQNGIGSNNDEINRKRQDPQPENDYEDIEELSNGKIHYEQTRKLLRSISAPPPTNENNNTTSNNNSSSSSSEDKNEENDNNNTSTPAVVLERKPPMNGSKLPFIPPHFPTPPQDALIKPSEYLRSIQNSKSKVGGSNNNRNGLQQLPSTLRVEETMKALGVPIQNDVHNGLMSPVPEETNAEDEFEEINPERMIGCVKMNGETTNPHIDTHIDENNNNGSSHPMTLSTIKAGCGGGGMIKAEELMKVNLRKTPMSRTKSAPPLGRVIPDDHVVESTIQQDSGHEPLKRTSTMSPTCNGAATSSSAPPTGESGAVSKADVIAELAQSSQVGGVREWKEELKRRQKEQEKAVQKEIQEFYQPVNFVSEVPSTDVTGNVIPDWKRQMMARKAAERARKEAEEQRRLEIEAKRVASIPIWRRQLLQRRESDAKYAQ